jgi:C-terminal processing protease CtpA/Prc
MTVCKVMAKMRTGRGGNVVSALLSASTMASVALVVKRVKEDGPALHLVKEGDLRGIVSIDDWPLNDISNVDLVRLTLGIPGTEATLRIIRAGVGEIPDVVILRPTRYALPTPPRLLLVETHTNTPHKASKILSGVVSLSQS